MIDVWTLNKIQLKHHNLRTAWRDFAMFSIRSDDSDLSNIFQNLEINL